MKALITIVILVVLVHQVSQVLIFRTEARRRGGAEDIVLKFYSGGRVMVFEFNSP